MTSQLPSPHSKVKIYHHIRQSPFETHFHPFPPLTTSPADHANTLVDLANTPVVSARRRASLVRRLLYRSLPFALTKKRRFVVAVSCKPGSDAWGIVQGLVSARCRAGLGPLPPLQKPAFRPNLPLPFLLTLSGHNSPPDVAREEHPWRLPRIDVMPRRHGDTRFDGMIRSVDTGQIVSK